MIYSLTEGRLSGEHCTKFYHYILSRVTNSFSSFMTWSNSVVILVYHFIYLLSSILPKSVSRKVFFSSQSSPNEENSEKIPKNRLAAKKSLFHRIWIEFQFVCH